MMKVFLSSTAKDLQEYRDAVFAAIQACDDLHCVRMEDIGALGVNECQTNKRMTPLLALAQG